MRALLVLATLGFVWAAHVQAQPLPVAASPSQNGACPLPKEHVTAEPCTQSSSLDAYLNRFDVGTPEAPSMHSSIDLPADWLTRVNRGEDSPKVEHPHD